MTKKTYSRLFIGALSLVYLLIFIGFYVTTYLPSVRLLEVSTAASDAVYYVSSILEYILPLIAAVTAFAIAGSFKKSILLCVFYSIPRIAYLLPYYYLYEIAYGNDSIESLLLSALISLAFVLLLALHTAILFLCTYFVTKIGLKKELIAALPPLKQKKLDKKEKKEISRRADAEIAGALSSPGVFDLSVPILMGIFSAALLDFLYLLVAECISAVGYLIEYAGTYTPEEILLMGLSFLFILFKLIFSYLIAIPVKNLALKMKDESELAVSEKPIAEKKENE